MRVTILIMIALCLPLSAQEKASRFKLAEGLVATPWATSPQILNPTNMDVDERGRIWITEAVNYRDFRNTPKGRLTAPKGDRVRVLEDTDGDGVCDSSKVFVQDVDLVAPLGLAVIGNKVFVSCSPSLLVFTDTDGDDVADKKEVLLSGFGGKDHDHGLHALVGGPGGRLWFNTGNAGPHVVRDKNGWTLRSGSIYNDGFNTNVPGLKSDDGRIWTGGITLSMEPDGSDLRVHSHNYRNCYEIAVDAFGDVWQNDNDDDGNQGCRIARVPAGANMGFFSADGTRTWGADRRPGQTTPSAHWHQEDPGVFPSGEITGAGAPTGIAVYETGALGEGWAGTLLSADAGRSAVFYSRPALRNSSYHWKSEILIQPTDPEDRWFRPADIVVGADGALYLADWHDPVVGGHLMRDKKGGGTIYRIAPPRSATKPIPVDLSSVAGAVQALKHPLIHVRYRAADALRAFGKKADPALSELLATGTEAAKARAVWLLAESDGLSEVVMNTLVHASPRLRITAMRALIATGHDPLRLANIVLSDRHPAVRAEFACHLRGLPYKQTAGHLMKLARTFDGTDRNYLECLGLAAEGHEAAFYADLVAKLGDQPMKWSAQMAALAWRLHPPAAIPALAARAMSAALDPAERRRAIDALGFCPEEEASAAMVTIATQGPEDMQGLARFWLQKNDGGIWKHHGVLVGMGGQRPADAEPVWSSGLMREGTRSGEVDLTDVAHLWLVVKNGGNGNGCDWADWLDPQLVSDSGSTPLTDLQWVSAHADWGSVNKKKNCVGSPLRVGELRFEDGIGTHANSEIHFALPPGRYSALRFKVGPDAGGTAQQSGSATSVVFEVYTRGKGRQERARAEIETLTAESTPVREKRRLAKALVADPAGGRALIGLKATGRLPAVVERTVGDRIHRNPDFTVRALATKWFPRQDVEGRAFPPMNELLAMKGDPVAGRRVFFGEKAACYKCHAHDGQGLDVGPDLTAVHSKYARAEILDNILSPSAGIAFGYEGWMFETADGRVHTGFLLADGPQVILKNTDGGRIMIPRDRVKSRRKLTLSTMPDNVALGLEPKELMDVVAFLGVDVTAEPKFGPEVALFNGRNLDGWTFHLNDSKASMADVWSVKDGVLSCRGNPIGYLRTIKDYTSFELTLEWRFDPAKGPGNSGVLLRLIGEDKVWPKSIEAQLMHRNAGDIWNIGEFGMVTDNDRLSGRRTAKMAACRELPLGEWNRYRIRLDHGRLTLEVNGEVQNRAWDCDDIPGKIALQSEGAAIQFRNIRLRPILD